MSTLHTVNKSPFERASLASCLGHCLPGDAVLLIEDGVVGARKGATSAASVAAALGACRIYALAGDLAARGIGKDDLVEGVEAVDYAGFVELAVQHARTQSWL